MAPSPLLIVAILTPRGGAMELFHEYERQAAAIMARYGGVIERRIVEEALPMREVHVVSFPDREAFERYRSDPDLAALAGMRAAAIAHTEALFGREGS